MRAGIGSPRVFDLDGWRVAFIVLAFTGLLTQRASAQVCVDTLWTRSLGTPNMDFCTGMTNGQGGTVVLCGYVDQISVQRGWGWLAKITNAGDTLWTRQFGGDGGDDIFHDVRAVPAGGYICAGITRSFSITPPQQDFWLVRVSENGDSLWSRAFGGQYAEQAVAVTPTQDGGFVIVGRANSFGAGGFDWWVVKTDQIGDSLWSHTFGGADEDGCNDVMELDDGSLMLAGYESSSSPSPQGQVLKLSQDGDSLWSHSYGGEGVDRFYAIRPGPEQGFLLAGYGAFRDIQASDMWVLYAGADGDSIGSVSFGGPNVELAYDLRPSQDGGYYIIGQTNSFGSGGTDMWVVKTDSEGDSLWSRTYGGSGDEVCFGGLVLPDRSLVLGGSTTTESVGQRDLWWLRTTPDTCNYPPSRPMRVSPQDSALASLSFPFLLTWSRARDLDQDPIQYIFHLETTYSPDHVFPLDTLTADTFVAVTIDVPTEPLDDIFEFRWRLWATDGTDTVEAENGEGYFQIDIPASANPSLLRPTSFDVSVYPNPFNNSTNISFSLSQSEHLQISIYDIQGRLVETLVNGVFPAGSHQLNFESRSLASGLYILRLRSTQHNAFQKLLLMK